MMINTQVEAQAAVNKASSYVVAAIVGALAVAAGSYLSVPVPGTPIPMTFQVPAILLVGALLGPRIGAASMVLYLGMGAAGLPVFAPLGAPGVLRLVGPTGGYLLAYPAAAAIMGLMVRPGHSWGRLVLGSLLGMSVIHLGGVAQLTILTGGAGAAIALGSLPFLAGDLLKSAFVVLVLRKIRGGQGAHS